jgi:uncharacterized protein (TIGR03086 family)
MELLDALAETFDHTTKVVSGIRPDQRAGATPCGEWDVQALCAHTLGVVMNMGRGASGADLLADVNAVTLDTDLGTQFRAEADRTLAAWRTRGRDDEVNIGAGPMPASVAMSINVLDTATHSWDLARATGQDPNLSDALAEAALECSHRVVRDDIRQFAGFDPAVTVGADAGPTDRLVAFLGRRA